MVASKKKQKRDRGRYLTDKGWNKIWAAIYNNFPDGYTFDKISKQTTKTNYPSNNDTSGFFVSDDTVSKILNRTGKSDIPYIKSLFTTFGLTLETDDYTAEPPASQQESDLVEKNPNFVGREEDIAHLNTLIHPGAVILIKAPGGTGKTKLAEQYTEQLKNQGYLKLELSMAKERENITAVESVIEEWLKQDFNEEPGREFGVTLGRLKRLLQTRKVCILIDNLEPALDENGRFIKNHRAYVELLRVLADSTVQSVTLITSRESVYEGVDIHTYELPKLTPQAWQEFFSIHKINIDTAVLEEMHKAYGGNALAMKVLCDPIIRDHSGNLAAYWQEHKIADDVLCEVAVDNLIKEQFERLEKLDSEVYKLLCRLGCYRYQDVPTVPNEGLLCLLWDVSEEKQRRRVIVSLRDRGLVEFQNGEYSLHPVIRQEARERLKASQDWETANRKAAEYWTESVNTIETVEDALTALEAYHHYVAIKDFEQAGFVIENNTNNTLDYDETLGAAFYRLGLLQPMASAIISIINNIKSPLLLLSIYNTLGDFFWLIGNIHQAIEYHQMSQKMAIKHCLKRWEVVAYLNIGLCYLDLGEIKQAEIFFEKLHQHSNNYDLIPRYKLISLFCLALINSILEFQEKASKFIEQYEGKVKETELNCWSKGYSLLFRGLTYKNLGQYKKSLEIYQIAREFAQKSNYTQVKAKALTGIGEIYRIQGDFDTAIKKHFESIQLLERIGAKCDLAEAYYQLALTYQAMGDTENSQVNFDKAIYIFDEQIKAPKQVEKVRRAMEGK